MEGQEESCTCEIKISGHVEDEKAAVSVRNAVGMAESELSKFVPAPYVYVLLGSDGNIVISATVDDCASQLGSRSGLSRLVIYK